MTIDPNEHVSPDETAQAHDPAVGSGTPGSAPWEGVDVEIPWLRRQPLIALALLILLTALGAAITTVAAGQHDPIVLIGLGTVGTIVLAGTVIVRRHVTPIADPKLAADMPLVVAGSGASVMGWPDNPPDPSHS